MGPEWVPWGDDWGAGVRFRCHAHEGHELRVMFQNPIGGLQAQAPGRLYLRTGSSFSELSIVNELDLGVCFRGWLIDGEFLEEVRVH